MLTYFLDNFSGRLSPVLNPRCHKSLVRAVQAIESIHISSWHQHHLFQDRHCLIDCCCQVAELRVCERLHRWQNMDNVAITETWRRHWPVSRSLAPARTPYKCAQTTVSLFLPQVDFAVSNESTRTNCQWLSILYCLTTSLVRPLPFQVSWN